MHVIFKKWGEHQGPDACFRSVFLYALLASLVAVVPSTNFQLKGCIWQKTNNVNDLYVHVISGIKVRIQSTLGIACQDIQKSCLQCHRVSLIARRSRSNSDDCPISAANVKQLDHLEDYETFIMCPVWHVYSSLQHSWDRTLSPGPTSYQICSPSHLCSASSEMLTMAVRQVVCIGTCIFMVNYQWNSLWQATQLSQIQDNLESRKLRNSWGPNICLKDVHCSVGRGSRVNNDLQIECAARHWAVFKPAIDPVAWGNQNVLVIQPSCLFITGMLIAVQQAWTFLWFWVYHPGTTPVILTLMQSAWWIYLNSAFLLNRIEIVSHLHSDASLFKHVCTIFDLSQSWPVGGRGHENSQCIVRCWDFPWPCRFEELWYNESSDSFLKPSAWTQVSLCHYTCHDLRLSKSALACYTAVCCLMDEKTFEKTDMRQRAIVRSNPAESFLPLDLRSIWILAADDRSNCHRVRVVMRLDK